LLPSSRFARLLPVVLRKYQDMSPHYRFLRMQYDCCRLRPSYATGKFCGVPHITRQIAFYCVLGNRSSTTVRRVSLPIACTPPRNKTRKSLNSFPNLCHICF
jgi:hypothetical protein